MNDISTDKTRLDVVMIHRYLSEVSYWARGIPFDYVQKAIDNSLCFGAYVDGMQVGFARVVTDYATFGYLCDVFVLDSHGGQGIAKELIATLRAHPDIQKLRRFSLVTSSANSLYEKFGWTPLKAPDWHMEKFSPDIYSQS